VGYVNVTVQGSGSGKFTMIANPLDSGSNTLANVIPTAPDGTTFYAWTGSGFTVATYAFGSWDTPNLSLAPGQGGFINTGAPFTNTFVGNVMTGNLSNPFSAGYSLVSSQVPQADTVDNLGLTPALSDGDTVYKWNFANQAYDIYTWAFGSWSPSVPSLAIGESTFLNTAAAGNWVRTFNPQ